MTTVIEQLWGKTRWAGRGVLRQQRMICAHFEQLELEYRSLCSNGYREQNGDLVTALRAEHADWPRWEVNRRFEQVVMAGAPDEVIAQRLPLYKRRLQSLRGQERTESNAEAGSADNGRGQALGILAEIDRLRRVRSEFERMRRNLLGCLFGAGALFGSCFLTVVYTREASWPPVIHVLVAGFIGGYFSVLLKLGALRFCAEYDESQEQAELFWTILCNLLLSIVEGMVGALILLAVFMSGLLKGSVFPEFPDPYIHGMELSQLLWIVPEKSGEVSKLIVWAVIAGFSERLIPDVLTQLTQQARAAESARGKRDGRSVHRADALSAP